MPKYEIRFNDVKNHPSFRVADTPDQAIAMCIKDNNDRSQSKLSENDVALCEITHKIPLRDVAIPFTKTPDYRVNVSLKYVESHINSMKAYGTFQMQPDFQRAHVWTEDQQIAFMKFLLREGESGRDIYFNRSGKTPDEEVTVLVDGLQRLTAVRKFMSGDLVVFGKYRIGDFEHTSNIDLIFHVNDLQTEAEVLNWYLEMNAGGTPHTEEELDKVRKMLKGSK